MIERIVGQIPAWMQSRNPVLRYMLGLRQTDPRTIRYRNVASILVLGLLWLLMGYLIANAISDENPLDKPFSQMLMDILFWPTFVIQVLLQVLVMAMTINTVGDAKRRQVWDSLKSTVDGASLTMRARWSAVIFYRMRGLVTVLMIVRLVLIAGILVDLTAFRGEYLNYLVGGITPDIPVAAGIVLLALTMTASLLLPITGLGFDASIGLFVSTLVQQRTYVVLAQISLMVVRIGVIVLLLLGMTQFREGSLTSATDLGTWLLIFGFAVLGDWGLSLLYLGFYGAVIWADVPYGVFIGVAMLVFVMFQAALTDGIISLAIRRAERLE